MAGRIGGCHGGTRIDDESMRITFVLALAGRATLGPSATGFVMLLLRELQGAFVTSSGSL